MLQTRPRPYRFTPAGLVLAQHGVRVRSVAEALGVSPQAISQQLAGHRRPHPSLLHVVAALASPEVAEEVAAALEAAQ
jgi:hypothetical protein